MITSLPTESWGKAGPIQFRRVDKGGAVWREALCPSCGTWHSFTPEHQGHARLAKRFGGETYTCLTCWRKGKEYA